MSRRVVLGVFDEEAGLLKAMHKIRREGLNIVDVFTPYAVHGLDDAMGLKPSRLPWLCFAAAVLGAILKLWFEFWAATVSWPLNVGGKPWNSLPAFVPVTFEVMVLSAGLTTVFAFFVLARLWPGKRAGTVYPGVSNDRFVVVLEESDAQFDLARVRWLLREFGALAIEERLEEE